MNELVQWSLLILGEALSRPTTSASEFAAHLGIAPADLETNLEDLASSRLLEAVADAGGSERRYRLTEKGRDLSDVIDALDAWSRRWALTVPTPATLTVEGDESLSPQAGDIEISMLGAFALRVGGEQVYGLSIGSQRLLVYLALHDRSIRRGAVAGAMWPDVSDERAGISLRAALSRLDPVSREATLVASGGLGLAGGVRVDLHDAQKLARRLLVADSTISSFDLDVEALAVLSLELLPDWYDDWVVAEAEDWRQLRMNALEALALIHLDAARYGEAAAAARAAMKVEPLRESPHAILIRVHLAKGNQSEALRAYNHYCELLMAALGLTPTTHLNDLVVSIQHA